MRSSLEESSLISPKKLATKKTRRKIVKGELRCWHNFVEYSGPIDSTSHVWSHWILVALSYVDGMIGIRVAHWLSDSIWNIKNLMFIYRYAKRDVVKNASQRCRSLFTAPRLTLLGLPSRFGDIWGQLTWILSGLSPKRDCSSKRVEKPRQPEIFSPKSPTSMV